MTSKTPLFTAGLLTVLIPVAALANFSVGERVGTDEATVLAAFEAKGYTVTEVETEDDEIEVEYTVDGQAFEVSIAVTTGMITEIELEDDDD